MHLIQSLDWWEYLVAMSLMGWPLFGGFLDAFKSTSQNTSSQSILYENAFNSSTSEISNLDGSTQITLGGDGQSSGGTAGIVVVAFAAVLILGGLYLLTRKR